MTARSLRYAFDLGTNSIGWAVYVLDREPSEFAAATVKELLGCGVRLFDDGRNLKDGRSLAEMRRVPRSARKRRDRFVMRRATLINQLTAFGMLPVDDDARRRLAHLDPYRLRADGLDGRLEPYEIGRTLMHINQRRGFRSNRRVDRNAKADDTGKIATGVGKLVTEIVSSGARTFGEYLWRRHGGADGRSTPRTRQAVRIRLEGEGAKALYAIYPSRQMLTDEFDTLLSVQAVHHPTLLTPDIIADIRETIFHQRQLKPVEVGRCTFVPTERRLSRALPSVEERVIYEVLNHLRFGQGIALDQKLSPDLRDLLATKLLRGENITISQLRREIRLGSEVRISLDEAGKSDLKDFVAKSAQLSWQKIKGEERRELFGNRWFTMPLGERDAIVQRLIEIDDEEVIVDWLATDYEIPREVAHAVAAWTPRDGHARIGPTANAKILAELRSPDLPTYAEAVKRAGWHHSDERDGVIELPLPYYGQVLERHVLFGTGHPKDDDIRRLGRFPNPTAHIALNQLQRVVNGLNCTYGLNRPGFTGGRLV